MWCGYKFESALVALTLLCLLHTLSAEVFLTEFKLTPIESVHGTALSSNIVAFLNSLSTGVTVTSSDIQIYNQTMS
jgi:hypothetical protein